MKQKHWILTFAAIIAVCLLVWLLPRGGGQTALVYQDGTLFYTLDLRQNRTLTVTGPAGKTIITVADGEVFVSHADCPDQVCVQHGPLQKNGGCRGGHRDHARGGGPDRPGRSSACRTG